MLCARRTDWLTPTVDELRARGFRVEGRTCDVSNADDVQAVVEQTIAVYGRIDVLVNNAGISWGAEPEAMPLDKWHKVLNVNLTGAFLCSQAVGRQMLQAGARIDHQRRVGGGTEVRHRGPHYAGYTASKAGLMGLTRELAASWGGRGVRVNAIAPGFFATRLTEHVIPNIEPRLKTSTPLGRVGAAGELKGAAVFLASDASSYVTGQVIVVDGGASVAG